MVSQLGSVQIQKQLKIEFIQQIAVQYYTALIFFLVFWVLTINQQRPIYFFIFIRVAPYVGNLMPKDNFELPVMKINLLLYNISNGVIVSISRKINITEDWFHLKIRSPILCYFILFHRLLGSHHKSAATRLLLYLCDSGPYFGKLLPRDNLQVKNSQYHNRNIYHVFPLVTNIFCSYATVVILCLYFPYHHQTYLQRFVAIYCFGILTSPSTDAAHELIHRPQKILKAIGFLGTMMFFFTVYPIEHLYLHHKEVGTERDPITSKKNQTIYAYIPKAYFSAHKFVFNYSKPIFFGCVALNIAYVLAIYYYAMSRYGDSQLAWSLLSFFILGGFLGFVILEHTEYIQHYGLIIRKNADKMVVSEQSSWNTDENMLHNWLVFRFQRHSDHHMNAYKFFTTMELTPTMPRFPMSFQEGVYMALIPPLWFHIMNPYVDEQIENKKVSASHMKLTRVASQLIMVFWFFMAGYFYYETVVVPRQN